MKSRAQPHVKHSSLAGAVVVLAVILSGDGVAATGDFDGDGQLGHVDINLLSSQIRLGSDDLRFDVNASGSVDGDDHDLWVLDLKRTGYGDANFDNAFDSSDLVQVFQFAEYEDPIPLNSGWECDLTASTRHSVTRVNLPVEHSGVHTRDLGASGGHAGHLFPPEWDNERHLLHTARTVVRSPELIYHGPPKSTCPGFLRAGDIPKVLLATAALAQRMRPQP